ncbi:hypothetical protein LSTR_LSTR000695 [Laodelphax striatellus]|uniref:Integrin alpha second immunoglobulin-like domain-containing protein n=1 Tax=Laodelphax striatellus TaxID=195883 RepID=A0A482XG39_LAOST|nr:hypothetical protein LSTR_LSTR000695 [Laodelphax striatellus]
MFLDRSITLYFLILFHENNGFNLNPKSNQLIRDPALNENSYFGFSVAFQKRVTITAQDKSNPWLIVGSPRSKIEYLYSSEEPGDVFKCDTANIESCYSVFNEKLLKEIKPQQWSNAWIGAVVKTYSYDAEHVILACGPRYGPDHQPGAQNSIDGVCFFLNGTSLPSITDEVMKAPVRGTTADSSFEKRRKRYLNRGFGQVWRTVTFPTPPPTPPPTPTILPLPQIVRGYRSIYGLSADFEKVPDGWSALIGKISINRHRWEGAVSKLNWTIKEDKRFLMDDKLENKRIKNSYFGYTVTAGKSSSEDLIYVSSPRNGSAGKVEVYQKQSNVPPKRIGFYLGEQTGEMFGASLCASDFNNDGIEDIVVGAPFFARSEESFNEGRISVIISIGYDLRNRFRTSYRYSGRKNSGAQFGLSLSAIGDLDKDGLPDIAVGAPYEDGQGAIYIFLGDRVNGLSEQFSQHIRASEVHHSLLGFGISMTGEQDVDFNRFDDIGVGSYLSSTVVLLKSKQVIKLRGDLKILSDFERGVISVNEKPVLISACVHYEAGQLKTDMAYVQIKIDVDKKFKRTRSVEVNSTLATIKGTTIEAVSEIFYNESFCLNFTFYLQEEIKNRDYELLIEMQNSTLNDDERCIKECPMTDPKLERDLTELRLPFETHVADLQLSSEFINISGSTYMHTSANRNLAIKVKFINKKDTAIATMLDIKIPSILSIKYVEGDERCKMFTLLKTEAEQTHYNCKFRNVKRNEERTIIMHLSTSDLTEEVDELIFNFTVSSSSKELENDLEDNDSSLALSVDVDTPLFISGYANPTEIIISKDEKNDIFKHVYDVSNRSPMKLAVSINITVPIPVIVSDTGRVPMVLLQGKLQLPYDKEITCSNDADESLKKLFLEWNDIPDQNFTRSLGDKMKLRAEKIMKNNFDCDHQSQLFTTESSIALACVNISCSSFPFEGNATVELRLRSSYKVFEYLIGTDGMRKFITGASVFLSHYRKKFHLTGIQEAEVETKITVYIHENPIWPLVLAIVLTLVLLIIITYGLYKANFFKRNRVNKDISNDAGATSTDNLLTE